MIDVSYRYSPEDLKGGKMMMDPDTGIETLVLPEPEHKPAPKPAPAPKPEPVVKKHAKT